MRNFKDFLLEIFTRTSDNRSTDKQQTKTKRRKEENSNMNKQKTTRTKGQVKTRNQADKSKTKTKKQPMKKTTTKNTAQNKAPKPSSQLFSVLVSKEGNSYRVVEAERQKKVNQHTFTWMRQDPQKFAQNLSKGLKA